MKKHITATIDNDIYNNLQRFKKEQNTNFSVIINSSLKLLLESEKLLIENKESFENLEKILKRGFDNMIKNLNDFEMRYFGEGSSWYEGLLDTCEENNLNFDDCIEDLFKVYKKEDIILEDSMLHWACLVESVRGD